MQQQSIKSFFFKRLKKDATSDDLSPQTGMGMHLLPMESESSTDQKSIDQQSAVSDKQDRSVEGAESNWNDVFAKTTNLTTDETESMKRAVKYLSQKEQQIYFETAVAAPRCRGHNLPSILRTTKKAGPNFGRRFWTCCCPTGDPSDQNTRCAFFQWVSAPVMKKSGAKK
eukprot:Gregarina_sp_Poly_1__4887@NODE_259_length_10475_cov_62_198501_g226_i0_p7_GENE_NODE_259_length_10475_cov_62_198501_g226_i0NODE_259_length_10475_cov_62_198501_g226_i0_p7_ORF_typecomplete_len170_score29_97zfGRF/PF06839_12/8_2e13SPACA9/PF15120_6/0_037_NODE_259_length_10475_cov_62_198501_g226_i020702579